MGRVNRGGLTSVVGTGIRRWGVVKLFDDKVAVELQQLSLIWFNSLRLTLLRDGGREGVRENKLLKATHLISVHVTIEV